MTDDSDMFACLSEPSNNEIHTAIQALANRLRERQSGVDEYIRRYGNSPDRVINEDHYYGIAEDMRNAHACVDGFLQADVCDTPTLAKMGKTLAALPYKRHETPGYIQDDIQKKLIPEHPVLAIVLDAYIKERNRLTDRKGCNPLNWVLGGAGRGRDRG